MQPSLVAATPPLKPGIVRLDLHRYTGNDDLRIHWLDYEVNKIGGEDFETVSVNLLVVLCVPGVFFGGLVFTSSGCWKNQPVNSRQNRYAGSPRLVKPK